MSPMSSPESPSPEPSSVPPLIVVAGATASGKTALSLALAEALARDGIAAEIISADSRQVYRGMDIGTAKVTKEERARVRHHGLDLVDPDRAFSVADYTAAAGMALAGISGRGAVAILAGGTGFYLRAVARGLALDDLPWDEEVRGAVESVLASEGLPVLVAELRQIAPSRVASIDLRNPRRVVRAVEVARLRGDAPLPEPKGYGRDVLWLGLSVPQPVLREQIKLRAQAQFDAGLIDETRDLIARYDASLRSFSGIGYAEAVAVIQGSIGLAEAIEIDARRNVMYARRQATWFRREPGICWLDAAKSLPLDEALDAARGFLTTVS